MFADSYIQYLKKTLYLWEMAFNYVLFSTVIVGVRRPFEVKEQLTSHMSENRRQKYRLLCYFYDSVHVSMSLGYFIYGHFLISCKLQTQLYGIFKFMG